MASDATGIQNLPGVSSVLVATDLWRDHFSFIVDVNCALNRDAGQAADVIQFYYWAEYPLVTYSRRLNGRGAECVRPVTFLETRDEVRGVVGRCGGWVRRHGFSAAAPPPEWLVVVRVHPTTGEPPEGLSAPIHWPSLREESRLYCGGYGS